MIHWAWLLLAFYLGCVFEHGYVLRRVRDRHRRQRYRAARRKGVTHEEAFARMFRTYRAFRRR
jgi:hypothetical protein